ncbi:MAG: metallophosphoesterase [Gemmatimonadota bacterium]
MQLAWVTDIHLEFLTPAALTDFCVTLAASKAEAFLIGGDISQAPGLEKHLRILERTLERPIFFVLGNHDYYHGKIERVREQVARISAESSLLHWLPATGIVPLGDETTLVGHDGWADGRYGDYINSRVLLNDYRFIEDFRGLNASQRLHKLQALGDQAATFLRAVLPGALERSRRVVVLTHVPPFAEAAWHEGTRSGDDWLPHFSSQAVGDVLREVMEGRPDQEMLVLCGHTHSSGEVAMLPNLKVITGGSTYGEPRIQREFSF